MKCVWIWKTEGYKGFYIAGCIDMAVSGEAPKDCPYCEKKIELKK